MCTPLHKSAKGSRNGVNDVADDVPHTETAVPQLDYVVPIEYTVIVFDRLLEASKEMVASPIFSPDS